ncbi:hypothetical protein BJAS_P2594 [Bathymodiolus japonicus methanotrophic gill symbiont]|nr:hypothetical protein BJAS_P2594 [Bathymodiolus japonicus methanotrophic gill symbiont]
MSNKKSLQQDTQISNGAIMLGTGLALASFIVLPAVAARFGIGSSLTGAMRIALMKASAKVCNNHNSGNGLTRTETCLPGADCN